MTYNANNQRTDAAGDVVYDDFGNPTRYDGVDCSYDGNDRLTAYGVSLTDARYTGDGLLGAVRSGGAETYFVYEGEVLQAESDTAGNLTALNIWGANGLIARASYANGVETGVIFYLYDPLGNVVHRTDAAGAVLSTDAYTAWGERLTGNPTGDPYGYKGQVGYYTDTATGLILCTYRWYDPGTGRWLTRDPIGYDGGINLYQYCGNDPVNNTDSSGKFPVASGDFGINDFFSMFEYFSGIGHFEKWAPSAATRWYEHGQILPAWLIGTLPPYLEYGPGTTEVYEIGQSMGIQEARRTAMANWVNKDQTNGTYRGWHTDRAAAETFAGGYGFWNPTITQVGAYVVNWTIYPEENRIRIRVYNDLMITSFFYHIIPFNNDTGLGPMHTVHQKFWWDETITSDYPTRHLIGPNPAW